MEAGRAIVREEGADALTLRKVASRAGVSSAAPYRHFHDKEALVAEVMRSGFAALREALAPCDGAAPLDRMHAIGHAYIAFAVREPSLYRLMFGPRWRDAALTPTSPERSAPPMSPSSTLCDARRPRT